MSTQPASLRQQLQDALGSSYTIERELAGGGMSRVFVAEEMRFGRRVVIKVLAPELVVGLSAERFEREIRLAAQLQQANIVPLFGAGEVNAGIPYYTMPFVEGESLRHRLDGRPFHPADAVAILRDVARALEYAHAHGVVHRDIKPENVLLSGGTAVVTDFGIAKALSASKTQAPGGTLTVVGTSLGTPAYMAPEQAVGDEVDSRADIYAWGIMAYEMLAGAHPFTGKQTAQQYITAHLAEAPKQLSDVRGDVHPDFSKLVMKAIEKDPTKRFSGATELLAALNQIVTSGGTTPNQIIPAKQKTRSGFLPGNTHRIIGVAALVTLILGGIGAFASRQRGDQTTEATATAKRVYVGEFRNGSSDASLRDVAAILQDGISRRLTETNVAELLASGDSGSAGAAALAKARSIGAGIFVNGSILKSGSQVQLSADLVDPKSEKILRSVGPIFAPASDPSRAVTELRERVLGTIGLMLDSATNDAIPAASSQTPLYAAFREFAEGESLARRNRFGNALTNYLAAYRLDSTFTFAAVRVARGYYNTSQCAKADSVSALLFAKGDGISQYEKAVLDRNVARCHGDWVAAYQAAKQMVDIAPESRDAQSVFSISAMYLYRADEALRGFLAAGRRSDEAMDINIAVAYHQLGRHEDERKVAVGMEKRFPGTGGSYTALLRAFAALRDTIHLRSVGRELASLPMGNGTNAPDLLRVGAEECARHGLLKESLAIRGTMAELMDALPQDRRDFRYWIARAENEYGLQQWPQASASLDSAVNAIGSAFSRQVFLSRRDIELKGIRGRIFARTGRRADAENIMRQMDALNDPYIWGSAKKAAAQIAAALGLRDEAVRLMRQAMLRGLSPVDSEFPDATPDLVNFTGYAPYEELFKPRG